MALGHLLAALEQRMKGVRWRVGGAEAIAQQEAPPRIVAEPVSETIVPARGNISDGARFPRKFLARATLVQFHIWGADIEDAEDLAERLWNAVQEVAPGAFSPGAAEWKGNSITDHGAVYVIGISFLFPVNRREQTRVITSIPITEQLVVD